MAKILIIFGSNGGNTEMVCDKVNEVLSKEHEVTVQRGELSNIDDMDSYDLTIFACPTYGQGVLQMHMAPIYYALRKKDCTGKKMAIIGLGDAKYDKYHHLESVKIFEKGVHESKGELIIDPLKIMRSPIPFIDSTVTQWAENLSKLV